MAVQWLLSWLCMNGKMSSVTNIGKNVLFPSSSCALFRNCNHHLAEGDVYVSVMVCYKMKERLVSKHWAMMVLSGRIVYTWLYQQSHPVCSEFRAVTPSSHCLGILCIDQNFESALSICLSTKIVENHTNKLFKLIYRRWCSFLGISDTFLIIRIL